MEIIVFVVWILGIVFMVRSGHVSAVAKSEANLRAKYDRGEGSDASRKLMREAGYNV